MLEKQGTFLTATTNIRPKTSHITRNKQSLHELVIDPEVGAVGKIKIYKDELRKLQAQYVERLKSINQSKKNVGKQYRDSQKKKVQFINLYENRKLKLTEQKLLEQKETRQKQYQKQVRNRAKTLKLNGQIRSLLIRNEIQQSNSVKTYKNKQQKNRFRQRLNRDRQRDLSVAQMSYSRIRGGEDELQEKKRKISQMQLIICKQNYLKKMGEQLKYISTFDKLLGQFNDPAKISDDCTPLSQQSTFFLTQKK